mmetsp:Transcript_5860/g.12346  ORF Transcript_5860/g.12346 Transcript_5860/m.12346 type:complete len:329 (-) Transcript_5860:2572-3558(-)
MYPIHTILLLLTVAQSIAFGVFRQSTRSSSSALFSESTSGKSTADEESTKLRSNRPFAQPIPANLRRKVQASRRPLGHVVPKHARKAQGGSKGPRLQAQGKAPGLNNPGMLKISAGSAKGRRLDSPEVYLRPMMGKVREAVFSTFTAFGLYDSSVAVRHLDIFAGSGSVGLESLSRGATHCTFVDLAQDCCDCVGRNVKWCNFDPGTQSQVICQDALQILREPFKCGVPVGRTFQIVTMCPPYEEVVYADLLESVANCPCVTDDTVVLIEYPIELGCLPHVIAREDGGAMVGVRNRRYGRTVIAMYVVNPTGRLESAESRPEEFISLR